jgi:rare lipoprotein A
MLALASLFIAGAAASSPSSANAQPKGQAQSGKASWYGPGFHGKRTASGERFNTNDLTAAHRTLPFGTRVRVVNKSTGRSVVVRINDRGPYAHGRVIDLSRASAQAIGIAGVGTVEVVQL